VGKAIDSLSSLTKGLQVPVTTAAPSDIGIRIPATIRPLEMLGKLELMVVEALWALGDASVHDVLRKLDRPLAYTTVMTTLDRLFKKGILNRRKPERAFRYTAKFTRAEWERKRAGDWFASFLSRSPNSGDLLLSSLVDAVGEQHSALLDELERKIALKREQLKAGECE
jgi:predicted transcriptional regulator